MKDTTDKEDQIAANLRLWSGIREAGARDSEATSKVPVYRGCPNTKMIGGCFCTGKCHEVIGYRDKLPGEA